MLRINIKYGVFAKIIHGFQQLILFAKSSTIDVWQVEYASAEKRLGE